MNTMKLALAAPFRILWTLWWAGSGFSWDQMDAKLRDPTFGLDRRLAREERYPSDR